MRGDVSSFSAISTYAAGPACAPFPPARTQKPFGPAVAVLGGVSIAAIAFSSFWAELPGSEPIETEAKSDRAPVGTVAPARQRALDPGFSLERIEPAAPAAAEARLDAGEPSRTAELPLLQVVRTEPAPQAPQVRAVSRRDSAEGISEQGSRSAGEAELVESPSGASDDSGATASAGLIELGPSRVPDGVGEAAAWEEHVGNLVVDRSGEPALSIVDSSPTAGLPVGTELAPVEVALTDATTSDAPEGEEANAIGEATGAWQEQDDSRSAVSAQSDEPPLGRSPDVHAASARAAIAGHLERLEVRYSSPAESAAPASGNASWASGEVSLAPGANASSADVPVEGTADVGLIIEDDQLVSIRLGELVSLFEKGLERPLYVWMRSSAAASKFVTPETLAAAGIRTQYDRKTGQIVFSVVEQ